ncbi:hypothetical protein HMPREF9370_2294 [Neisseria wadsworthii 9715]|uniref:Uncharacterized protein n=1 Tax=Neisseria wadsworthii 9715 TaxID=1030841 RepID=G4CT84_9NEIS|nr:hypothetical protein HMPREF9370_2294 [Neisseria wadsworthii 9715]
MFHKISCLGLCLSNDCFKQAYHNACLKKLWFPVFSDRHPFIFEWAVLQR